MSMCNQGRRDTHLKGFYSLFFLVSAVHTILSFHFNHPSTQIRVVEHLSINLGIFLISIAYENQTTWRSSESKNEPPIFFMQGCVEVRHRGPIKLRAVNCLDGVKFLFYIYIQSCSTASSQSTTAQYYVNPKVTRVLPPGAELSPE